MSVQCKEKIERKSQDEFHAVDRFVTGAAFSVQNSMGRFFDEKIYQSVLTEHCREAGLAAIREVEVRVSYRDYTKAYKLDLLVENGVVYELKAVKALNASHRNQLLNYLFLLGLHHGKLLNFRTTSVEHEYVSTSLTFQERLDFKLMTSGFSETSNQCRLLQTCFENLLGEWGARLDVNLYSDALTHFLGGVDNVICPVDVYDKQRVVGNQQMHLLDQKTAFHISSISKSKTSYENNIRSLLGHTALSAIQWINMNGNAITLKTLSKK